MILAKYRMCLGSVNGECCLVILVPASRCLRIVAVLQQNSHVLCRVPSQCDTASWGVVKLSVRD